MCSRIDEKSVITSKTMKHWRWTMNSAPDYAIEIHAKALAARFKGRAKEEAELHAKMLKKSGDKDGYEVWMMVAKQIKKIKKEAK